MVQDGRLGRARGRAIVVARDRMEELGQDGRVEVARTFLDGSETEMDVAEQATFLRLAERWAASELTDAADVVQQRGREDEICAEARMQLRRLAAERRDADGVFEQPSGVAVVTVGTGRRQRAESCADLRVPDEPVYNGGESRMRDLCCEELEEAVELVGVPTERRCERSRVGVLHRLDRAHLHLQLSAEALDASQHADGVSLGETLVEQLDVAPDARLDAPTRIGELEREV